MEPEVVVRAASEHVVDAIAAFGVAVVPPHYEPIIGKAAAEEQVELWWTPQRLRTALASGALLVAKRGDELVGVPRSESGRLSR